MLKLYLLTHKVKISIDIISTKKTFFDNLKIQWSIIEHFLHDQPGLSQIFEIGGTRVLSLSYIFSGSSSFTSYLALYIPYVACPHHPYSMKKKNKG